MGNNRKELVIGSGSIEVLNFVHNIYLLRSYKIVDSNDECKSNALNL